MKDKLKLPRVKGLRDIISACTGKKAEDIVILDMRSLSSFTEYFVLVSGDSTAQTRAIARAVEDKFKKKKFKIYHIEGIEDGRWIVVDTGYIIVHIFMKEARDFYNLELLWADAPEIRI